MAKETKRKRSKPILDLIEKRLDMGYERFKDELPVDDGRDWLQESLEEILDGMIYIANKIVLLKIKENNISGEPIYCISCGSRMGMDCGDAEPDFDENFCSVGCYQRFERETFKLPY